jgi:hypothetical protein
MRRSTDSAVEEIVHRGRNPQRSFTEAQARAVADEIGLDLSTSLFNLDAFRRGMGVELEHGSRDPQTNVTDDDPWMTGKIAWAHLKELPDYYERLEVLEHQPPRTGDALRKSAIGRIKKKSELKAHLFAYAVVNALLVVIWAITGTGYFWPIFPMLGWGIGVVFNVWDVYRRAAASEEQIQREMHRL